MFAALVPQELSDKHWLTDGNAQHLQPLLGNWQVCMSLPYNGVQLQHSRCSGEFRNSVRQDPSSVPNLGLAKIASVLNPYSLSPKKSQSEEGEEPERPVNDKFAINDDDVDFDTVTESDLSLKSRSFLHRVNDRVRKMQDQSSEDLTQDSNKHSLIRGMFMSSTLEAPVFMGNHY